ncbi:MAG: secondary thiamine-phosphate synthase enzyme YjbQ [Candidatus Omnitrophica bacterium]|nr:secondary thiamine-phosphate synthase enzyme YjbQ [Candidatus Omnitrophota bacterium]
MSLRVVHQEISLATKGNPDLVEITPQLTRIMKSSGLKKGTMTVFVVGSTAAITTFEYEPGMVEDVKEFFEKIIPRQKQYHHDETWGDANGFSHLRAALQGPSLVIPFNEATLLLGTWQQVVVAEFDTRARTRQIIVQLIGE